MLRSPFRLFAGMTGALWMWVMVRYWLHTRGISSDMPHWFRVDITIPVAMAVLCAGWATCGWVRVLWRRGRTERR